MKSFIKKFIPFTMGQKIRGLWQKFLGIYYSGKTYYCPYCKNSFRKMLPGGTDLPVINEKEIIGAGRRENCVCPRCYSTDRDRLLYLYFNHKPNTLRNGVNLLHVAPEGALKAYFASIPNIKYTMGTKHHDGFYYSKNILLLDITEMISQDNIYDIIICNHVLEHIPDDMKAMVEIYRVLKPGGWAILQVPISKKLQVTYEDFSITDPIEREKYFGQFDHVRIYGQDYKEKLISAGFDVEVESPVNNDWNVSNIDKYAINNDELIYIARKP